ncbi:hypothetical protein BXY66_1999 [Shimia isoporae]|uniref:Outer membrane beta-barrel porin/alpha-amylase n=1 Tax=Shimia isoporae TaxID=647720 RepID=A0A4R1NXM3_9RHOB|nr:hypothetical protein [Shimia isoporae]TCL09932.1 hypothetical protein BXY66_1999 [Shimia isoporae]
MFKKLAAVMVFAAFSAPAVAQTSGAPDGWVFRFEGAYFHQQNADLNTGGQFSVDRTYGQFTAVNRNPDGISFGVSASLGQSDYDFGGGGPWGTVKENSIALSFSGQMGNGGRWFVAPSVRSRYDRGASSSDGRSAGLFAGISWRINDNLIIGPAFGAFEGLGGDKYDIFPALLLDWRISDRWSLTTGPTIGASQGPGLSLRYDVAPDWGLTLSARSEKNRFALAGGGVGQDSSIPVVLSVSYDPNPGMSFAVFAGAEFDGVLQVETATGVTTGKSRYDTAPLMGVAFSLSF